MATVKRALITCLASKLELPALEAEQTVDHLIRAEQAGKHDHGLIRIDYLLSSGKFGPYGFRSAPTPTRVGPGLIHLDGDGHLGYAMLEKFVEMGCNEALREGTCTATSVAVYPSGALLDWAHQALARGVGVILVASSPPRMTWPGGTRPVVGTNPICVGLPAEPFPFVADSATSAINHGALLLARANGSPLPLNSATDSDGRPTVDARAVDPTLGNGALLPVGASHKVFALAMAVELLSSLGGGSPGSSERSDHGVFCYFMGPRVTENARTKISTWLQHLDNENARVPGWTSFRGVREQQALGTIRVRPDVYEKIKPLLAQPRVEPGSERGTS